MELAHRGGVSNRVAAPCPCPVAGARAARLIEGTTGTPEGRLRTEGAKLTAFLTKDIANGTLVVVVAVKLFVCVLETQSSLPDWNRRIQPERCHRVC